MPSSYAIEFLRAQGLLDVIVAMLGGPHGATALRATCRAARAVIPAPQKLRDADALLLLAARDGNGPLCWLARERGAGEWDWMLRRAAENGHQHICRLAREWGANDWNAMLYGAACGGHEHMCWLAKEWGASEIGGMFYTAAVNGHERVCRLAVEWGF